MPVNPGFSGLNFALHCVIKRPYQPRVQYVDDSMFILVSGRAYAIDLTLTSVTWLPTPQ